LQQPQYKYSTYFNSPKIIFPDIAKESRFTLDTKGNYIDMTCFTIPGEDLYLLGVLNSKYVENIMYGISSQIRGGYIRFKRQYVEQIPIPQASDADRQIISSLVEQCLAAKGQGVESLEAQINERVAWLYGLNEPQGE